MVKNRQIPHEPNPVWRLVAVGCTMASIAYALLFFQQPSLSYVDADGNSLPRWIDLSQLVSDEPLIDAMFGHGRLKTGILDRVPILIAASAWICLASYIGGVIVTWSGFGSRASRAAKVERLSLSGLVGLSVLSTVVLAVGLVGGIGSRWPLLLAVSLVIMACRYFKLRLEKPTSKNASNESHIKSDCSDPVPVTVWDAWALRLVPVATVILAVLYVLGGLVTPYEFDVLEYHLQAPKEFMQAGFIGFNDHNVYVNMPLAAEMHTLAAMVFIGGEQGWWWGGLVGKLLTASYALLGAGLIGGFTAKRLGGWSGWCAAGLFLASPGNAHVSMSGLIDSAVGAYLIAFAIVAVTLISSSGNCNQSSPTNQSRLVFLAAFLAGSAGACKYPGLIFAIVPLGVVVALMIAVRTRENHFNSARIVLSATIGVAITCGPWLLKNAVQTGNPFYPLAYSIFGGLDLDEQSAAQWDRAHRTPVPAGSTSAYDPPALAGAFWQLFISSPFLPPTLIALALTGIVSALPRQPNAPSHKIWVLSWSALALWILVVWLLATHRIDRFWVPVLPIYAVFAALGAHWLAVKTMPWLSTLLVLLSLAYGIFIASNGTQSDNRFFVQLAELRTDAGDEQFPARVSPVLHWLNENLPATSTKLGIIGEVRVYDFPCEIVYATCFNNHPIEDCLRGKPPADQLESLQRLGVTHIFIHWEEIERYRAPNNYGFSDWPTHEDMAELCRHGVLVPMEMPFGNQFVELFEVPPSLRDGNDLRDSDGLQNSEKSK